MKMLMIENFGDLIAMAAMILFVGIGFWMIYAITIRHREEDMKRREALYYRYYAETEDDSDSDYDDRGSFYYED